MIKPSELVVGKKYVNSGAKYLAVAFAEPYAVRPKGYPVEYVSDTKLCVIDSPDNTCIGHLVFHQPPRFWRDLSLI